MSSHFAFAVFKSSIKLKFLASHRSLFITGYILSSCHIKRYKIKRRRSEEEKIIDPTINNIMIDNGHYSLKQRLLLR